MWTVETLKEHFEKILAEKDKAVSTALDSQEKAILKAEAAAERRFELLNELRGGVATKEQIDALDKRVTDHQTRLDTVQGRDSGKEISWGKLLGAAGFISTLLGIFYVLST